MPEILDEGRVEFGQPAPEKEPSAGGMRDHEAKDGTTAPEENNTGRAEDFALRPLRQTRLAIARHAEDIRGYRAVAEGGEQVGKVDQLLVDCSQEKVRFLRISSGGLLGIGARKFLLPVDAVSRIHNRLVVIDQTRTRLRGAPRYDPALINRREHLRTLYGYYGYAPFWSAGYVYPPYPFYLPPRIS